MRYIVKLFGWVFKILWKHIGFPVTEIARGFFTFYYWIFVTIIWLLASISYLIWYVRLPGKYDAGFIDTFKTFDELFSEPSYSQISEFTHNKEIIKRNRAIHGAIVFFSFCTGACIVYAIYFAV